MEPNKKSPVIEEVRDNILGHSCRDNIHHNKCTWCGKDANIFKDIVSQGEYTLSGFCQKCQDKTFGRKR